MCKCVGPSSCILAVTPLPHSPLPTPPMPMNTMLLLPMNTMLLLNVCIISHALPLIHTHLDGGHDAVVVVQRLAHAHEHDVGDGDVHRLLRQEAMGLHGVYG